MQYYQYMQIHSTISTCTQLIIISQLYTLVYTHKHTYVHIHTQSHRHTNILSQSHTYTLTQSHAHIHTYIIHTQSYTHKHTHTESYHLRLLLKTIDFLFCLYQEYSFFCSLYMLIHLVILKQRHFNQIGNNYSYLKQFTHDIAEKRMPMIA